MALHLLERLRKLILPETESTSSPKQESDPKLEELLNEKQELEVVSNNLAANTNYLFHKYEEVTVDFIVYMPDQYKEKKGRKTVGEKAQNIIDRIFEEYVKLEYPIDSKTRNYVLSDLKTRFKNNPTHDILHDSSNWRLSIRCNKDPDEYEKTVGFTVRFIHNKLSYPTRNGLGENNLASQHRYRVALNAVEIALVTEGAKYQVRTF